MNKVFKPVAIILTIILYCFTLSQYSGNALSPKNPNSSGQSKQVQTYFAVVSTTLICQDHQTQSIINGIHNPYLSLKKNFSDDLLTIHLVKEHLLLSRISKYASYFKTLSVSNKITILIFPFHSFL
jgi:hypothetical protein